MHRIKELDVAVRILREHIFDLLRCFTVRIIEIIYSTIIQRNTSSSTECRRKTLCNTSTTIRYNLSIVFITVSLHCIRPRFQERNIDRIITDFYMREHLSCFFGQFLELIFIGCLGNTGVFSNQCIEIFIRY